MAGDGEDRDIDDVAALMEKLWGPREQSPLDAVAAAPNGASGLHPVEPEPETPPDEPVASDSGELDAEALSRSVERVVSEQLAALRVELTAAITSVEDRLGQRIDALAASVEANAARLASVQECISGQLEAAAAHRVAVLRRDAIAVPDGRIPANRVVRSPGWATSLSVWRRVQKVPSRWLGVLPITMRRASR